MSERQVQRQLFSILHSRYDVLMPNYTPRDWFECDLFGVTKAGYFQEFEIKMTLADFKKDAEKAGLVREPNPLYVPNAKVVMPGAVFADRYVSAGKHDRLARKDERGPSRFWFVLPEGLMPEASIPPWAGVYWFTATKWPTVGRQAPKLHGSKIAESITSHALGVCYYRYWAERNRRDDEARLRTVSPTTQGV